MSRFSHKSSAVALAALSVVALAVSSASADISGFVPANYTYQFNDTGNTPVVGNDSIELTTGRGQLRSLWFKRATRRLVALHAQLHLPGPKS